MGIYIRTVGDITIMDLEGELVQGAPVRTFRDQLQALLEEGKIQIVVNLNGVPFLDSSGIGAMLTAVTLVLNVGGRYSFCAAQPLVMRTLMTSHQSGIIHYHETEAQAVASLNAPTWDG